eukprot:5810440-Pleurochrysis_carterae.AAC.1
MPLGMRGTVARVRARFCPCLRLEGLVLWLSLVRAQMARFRKCNSTLFHNNERIRKLPTPELFAYMS